ncbi:MAG: MopE-related protein, partial [Myxococcota bacterium]|nr:MopE-related protein [Myxococcota bacterium]
MRAIAPLLASTLALAVLGCSPTTEVIVLVDAQAGARTLARSLRVRVIGTDGTTRLDETRTIDGTSRWPLRLPLVPEGGDASRAWTVEATLTDATGASVSRARSRGGYVAGAARESLLCLYDGCGSDACACGDASCETCRATTGAPGCVDARAVLDVSGSAPRCPIGACVPTSATEQACGDGADDDCDGRIDCADYECGCDAGACTPSGTEDVLERCSNGLDDDCDGLVDCDEGGVCIFAEGPDGCDNGLDDDCDGLVDCMDPTCCSSPSCDQEPCGGGGLVCCAGACVDTWSSEQHCGTCGIACASGRACNRVPGPDG